MVGGGQLEPEQPQHAVSERLGLTQGKMKDEAQRQHQLDRQVGMARLSARRRPTWRLPSCQRRFVQPEGQVATAPQSELVRRPIRDQVA